MKELLYRGYGKDDGILDAAGFVNSSSAPRSQGSEANAGLEEYLGTRPIPLGRPFACPAVKGHSRAGDAG
jgi:hypothetical protein